MEKCLLVYPTACLIFADVAQGQLSDLFGVDFSRETEELVTYVSPETAHLDLFPSFSAHYPVTLYDTQVKVRPHADVEVIASLTLPYIDPKGQRSSGLLTDAPGIETEYPSVILNRFGAGTVLYAAGTLEIWEYDTQRIVFRNLLRVLVKRPFDFEVQAPKAVEVTLFEQEENRRYILHLLNFQHELPNIPVSGISITIFLDKKQPLRLLYLPESAELSFSYRDGTVQFTAPTLTTYAAFALSIAKESYCTCWWSVPEALRPQTSGCLRRFAPLK